MKGVAGAMEVPRTHGGGVWCSFKRAGKRGLTEQKKMRLFRSRETPGEKVCGSSQVRS